ncbi:MAG: ABC transporter ATP-binding protein [Promethearchaeia archaeon]
MSKTKTKTVLKLEDLTKRFGELVAVDGVNLEVHEGETIGLVGPNGAGKTTTIKMIAQLLRPNKGRILIRDKTGELQELNGTTQDLVKRGFLIDIPSFYEDMTAYQLLKYFAKLQEFPKEKIDEHINELMDLFQLSEWKYEKVENYSKGMTQKLGIIQAIIHDPRIIILDEPQTGLDPKARIEVRKFLRYLQDQGKTIFVASHMLYEISEVCDKVALLNRGKIIAFDTISNLEKTLKTNELNCELLNPIPPDKLSPLIDALTKRLKPYLDNDLDPNISKLPVKYNPKQKAFKIYYDGKEKSKAEILKILIKEFESKFTVTLFTAPRTSQLEQIYSEKIKDIPPTQKGGQK